MKKSFVCLCAGAMLLTLAECITDYAMTVKSGQTIATQGKPKLDRDTGTISYTDQDRNVRKINSSDITQSIEMS